MVKNLTEGKPLPLLFFFALPMVAGNLFQQLYNMVDTAVVGKFVGEDAVAAVGSSFPIVFLSVAVASGLSMGCNVVVSQLFGAGRIHEMKSTISTAIISLSVLGLIIMGLGTVFAGPLLHLLGTDPDIMADSELYLQIYFGGAVFLFLYNTLNGIYNAQGDSKTPLIFLIISSLTNIVLDLLFVIQFDMRVAGVAWATFIAQGIACVLALLTLVKRLRTVETKGKYEIFSFTMLKKISMIAIPSILQQSFVSVGNIFIQSLVNSFGSSVIAGYSAAIKLNTFSITCFSTLGNGVSSFTAQNLGAGKVDRARKGLSAGVKMGLLTAIPFFIAFFIFGQNMVQLFMSGDASALALDTGIIFLRIVAPFYFVISIKLVIDGMLRGAGAMGSFMIATFTDLILRVILSYIMSASFGVTGIWMSWPIGWSIATALSVIFYWRGKWADQFKAQ